MVFKMRPFSLPKPGSEEDPPATGGQVRRFSLRQLKIATDNFSSRNMLGEGGFGTVYKGRLLVDGSLVAVKRLRVNGWHVQEYKAEMLLASITGEHPNLLRLRGYCITKKERLLVYPFIPNGDLASRLFSSHQGHIDWPTRKRVALGLAKGLAYLHQAGSHFNTLLVHLDVKPANILLDHDFKPVLADFGLSRTLGQPNSNWENQYPFLKQETEEEDSEEESIPDHTETGGGGGLTKCWNLTKTMVKSDISSIVEVEVEAEAEAEAAVREEDRTCTWSCFWQCTTTISRNGSYSQSTRGIIKAQDVQEEEQLIYTTYGRTSRIVGTYGYTPPEYTMEGIYSPKNDVFGYGITLLELISGQKITQLDHDSDTKDISKVFGSQPAKCCYKKLRDKQLHSFVDPCLSREARNRSMEMEVEQLIRVALLCLQFTPKHRPKMSQVVQMLQGSWVDLDPVGLFGFQHPHLIHQSDALTKIENGGLLTQSFLLPQLELATDNFSNNNIIGRSRFNIIYKGCLQHNGSGSAVVVKRLVKRSRRARMQFRAEVKLGGIRHPNLLQLRGYCIAQKEMLLVYPFMPNRSLEWQLRPERNRALDWHVQKQIALGVAKGIAYLHYDCDSRVSIHRNVKPCNILLDADFNPVLCNLRLQSNENSVDGAAYSINDVYGYGITLFVLISGKVSYNDSELHNWFKKRRHRQHELLLDPRLDMGNDIKDEIEQLIQVALLCTQPSPKDRPEMWQVINMLQVIKQGDLKANLVQFDEVELRAMMDTPRLDSEGSLSSEFDQTNEAQLNLNPKKYSSISSKGKQVASFSKAQRVKSKSQRKGISMSNNVLETFISEVVSGVLPTKSRLWRSGMSADPLCPMCNEYEEDSFHLFFNCDFSKQAWLLAVGVRIDMLGLGSVQEAVDVMLKPDAARLNILPWDLEPSRFTRKSVALMHSIWTHRNQVCFDNVSPNVIWVLKDHPDAINPYESQIATHQEMEAWSGSDSTLDADGSVSVASDLANCESIHEIELAPLELEKVLISQVLVSQEIEPTQLQPDEVLIPQVVTISVRRESSQEIETAQSQPNDALLPQVLANRVQCESVQEVESALLQQEQVLISKVLEAVINNNQQHDFQLNITSGGIFFSFNFTKLSVLCVILLASLCMNLVLVWPLDKRY